VRLLGHDGRTQESSGPQFYPNVSVDRVTRQGVPFLNIKEITSGCSVLVGNDCGVQKRNLFHFLSTGHFSALLYVWLDA
jgi:hypothetical protein